MDAAVCAAARVVSVGAVRCDKIAPCFFCFFKCFAVGGLALEECVHAGKGVGRVKFFDVVIVFIAKEAKSVAEFMQEESARVGF